jgi:hypothetical protein
VPAAPARLVRATRAPDGGLCRDYVRTVLIEGRRTRAAATVCRDGSGEWRLAAAAPALSGTGDGGGDSPFCPRPGTVVETSIGGYFRFTHGDGPRCWFRNAAGALEARYGAFLAGDSAWLAAGGTRLRALFPLAVGKEVWFTVAGVTAANFPSSWDETYTVVGRERVTVPAGTFDAFVVTWEETGRLGNDYAVRHTYWYAPEVGYVVRFRAGSRMSDALQDWEATRIVVPPAPSLAAGEAPPRR